MKQRLAIIVAASAMLLSLAGCATVHLTQTSNEFFPPVRSNQVEVLMMKPSRPYVEIATISTQKWDAAQTAKMHNALRGKAAPLGANAVVLLNNGIDNDGKIWTTGVAIRYVEDRGQARVE